MNKTKLITASIVLLLLPFMSLAQQARQIKVSEINVSNINTIEERTFLIHTILEEGYFCYVNPDHEDAIDIYIDKNAPDELSDFDFFYDNLLYEKLNEFSYLDKNLRGELYVQWRQEIDDDVNRAIYASFMRNAGRSDNATCETAAPFCTDQGAYLFPAGVNSGSPCGSSTSASCGEPYSCSGTPGQSSNCLMTAPNPAFYYMKIDEPGDLIIYMESNPREDIDFDCWGPFDDMETACDQLACSNIVDCGYSTSPTENCHINGAQTEEFYILLITNYSNQPCNITFENRGTGTTDCGILPPLVDNDGPYCSGEAIHLSAHGQSGATYSWTGPNGFTSTEQNPIINNATVEMSGSYTCTITLAGQSSSNPTEVIVSAIPEPTASAQATYVNYGSSTQLNVDPGVQGTFSYHWEPADMVNDPDIQNPTTVALTNTQEFSVTVVNTGGNGNCTGFADVTIEVGSGLTVSASADEYEFCENGTTTLHAFPTNGTNNYTYSWEPAELLNNPNVQNPVAAPNVGTNTFTCHVDDGWVTRDASVVILVHPNGEPQHIYDSICRGETYYFHDVPYTTTTETSYMGYTEFGCESPEYLHLTRYEPDTPTPTIVNECNDYPWSSMGKPYTNYTFNGQPVTDETLTLPGTYQRTYENLHGCDSVVTINATFEYTPNPYDFIMLTDGSYGEATHAVITASEFQINTYEFTIIEQGRSHWNKVTWTLKDQDGNDVEWDLDFSEGIGQVLKLTVFQYVPGRLYLTATAENECGSKTVTHWLECTFYGVEEQSESLTNVDIVPNPNNGEMTLNFEHLTGKVNIKVYDMKGNLIDNFETYNSVGPNSMKYDMKGHADGMYFFVIAAKEGTVTKKVIIEK